MSAVWMRLRAELRRRWRTLLALGLLAGIPGGAAIGIAIAADRTDTVMDRLTATSRHPDIFYPPDFQETKVPLETIASLPMVIESAVLEVYGVAPGELEDLEPSVVRGIALGGIDRVNLIDGRPPDPDRADEGMINFRAQERYGWQPGDVVTIPLAGVGGNEDEEPPPGPIVRVTITGVTSSPGDFVGVAAPGLELTPAFARTYGDALGVFEIYGFRLERGVADLVDFERALRELTGSKAILYAELRSGVAQSKRGFHVQAVGLWALCLAIATVATFTFAQTMARQTTLESGDHRTLYAIGMTRRSLGGLGMLRAVVVAVIAVAVAAAGAAVLSAFTPFGRARFADPHHGASYPGIIYGGGLLLLFGIVVGVAAVPAWRTLASRERVGMRGSWLAGRMRSVLRRPSWIMGARLALEPGQGTTAVPVRSALTASITAIVALLAALTVGSSIDHLLKAPPLYGSTWDATVGGSFGAGSADLAALVDDSSIDAVATGFAGETAIVRLGEESSSIATGSIATKSVKGSLGPPIVEGRAPERVGEVALGRKTLSYLGLSVGRTVRMSVQGLPDARTVRIVGVVVLPFDDDIATVGDGAWMTPDTLGLLAGDLGDSDTALVRFAPGVDDAAARRRLAERFEFVEVPSMPGHVRDFGNLSDLTVVVAAPLALLAAATLTHMLVTSITRRRRDLAILKALGFSRGQVRSTVGWQAAVFAVVALAVAFPVGIIAGRWTWRLIARSEGFGVTTTLPSRAFAIVGASALLIALLIASVPARSAVRTKPALALRAE